MSTHRTFDGLTRAWSDVSVFESLVATTVARGRPRARFLNAKTSQCMPVTPAYKYILIRKKSQAGVFEGT